MIKSIVSITDTEVWEDTGRWRDLEKVDSPSFWEDRLGDDRRALEVGCLGVLLGLPSDGAQAVFVMDKEGALLLLTAKRKLFQRVALAWLEYNEP